MDNRTFAFIMAKMKSESNKRGAVLLLEDIIEDISLETTSEIIDAIEESDSVPETAVIIGVIRTDDLPNDMIQGDITITKTTNVIGHGVYTLDLASDNVAPYRWFWVNDMWNPYGSNTDSGQSPQS